MDSVEQQIEMFRRYERQRSDMELAMAIASGRFIRSSSRPTSEENIDQFSALMFPSGNDEDVSLSNFLDISDSDTDEDILNVYSSGEVEWVDNDTPCTCASCIITITPTPRRAETLGSKKKRKLANIGVGETCSICLDDMKATDKRSLLKCKHVFHHACLLSWTKRNKTCPIDRSPSGRATIINGK
jgi:hypothetical protein